MPNKRSVQFTLKNAILITLVSLISVGSLASILFEEHSCRGIDERSDRISFTYRATAGGVEFHYNSGCEDPVVLMGITAPGRFDITYHYFNGSTYNLKFTICEVSTFQFSPYFDYQLQGEWANGWVVDRSNESSIYYSFAKKDGEFPLPYCNTMELEKIEVNGDVAYFTTSWKDVEVDTW